MISEELKEIFYGDEELAKDFIESSFEKMLLIQLKRCDAFGEKYNSIHEAWAVLKEEVEEVKENIDSMLVATEGSWNFCRTDNVEDFVGYIPLVEKFALQGIMELIQVLAVAWKIQRGTEK